MMGVITKTYQNNKDNGLRVTIFDDIKFFLDAFNR
jgi:hypothetical protein